MKYDPSTEKLEEETPDKGLDNTIEEFYSRLGQRFPVSWDISGRPAVPKIKKEDLPSDVTVSDVETVLNNMKADGWF